MPSASHAAELERVLWRAAQECESKAVWFGDGLPQLLRHVAENEVGARGERPAEVAFVEVSAISPQGRAHVTEPPLRSSCSVIGLSTAGLEELSSLFGSAGPDGVAVSRLICPVAVFDFTPEGLRVRELKHGLTAADLQRQLPVRLWSGPDLKELGTH